MKEKLSVQSFIEEFVNKKITNNKVNNHAIEDFIKEKLDIVEYVPFNKKREIIDMIVAKVVVEEDGVKKVNSVDQFLSFFASMIIAHTNLVFGEKPEEDYDALNKNGLIEPIIAMFQKDYSEFEVLLKMAIADELADNNLNVIVGKFLNGILDKLDGVGDMLKGFTDNLDLPKLLGTNINEEEKAKFLGLLDKLIK